MLTCPHCHEGLEGNRFAGGKGWACRSCGGQALTLPVLKRHAPAAFVRHVWVAAREPGAPDGKPCPSCKRSMREVPGQAPVFLDVCPRCQIVWFDAMELDTVPRQPVAAAVETEAAPKPKSPEAAEALARFELDHRRRVKKEHRSHESATTPPGEIWKYIPALMGMPVEFDASPVTRRPWATWGLMAVVGLVSVLAFSNIEEIAKTWGLIPSQPLLHGGVNLLTSFFLHGGWMHLLGNLYFLWIFGDDVEELLGWSRFLILVAASALVGDILHVIFGPADLPTIGSSGGISGILAFYALALPHTRLGLLFFWMFWIRVPAWGYLIFWVFLQILGTATGGGGVAYTAHLGGALAGFALWFLWKEDLLRKEETAWQR